MRRFFRTYDQAIEFIFGRINYERVAGIAYSADDGKLERMRRLLALLDHPEERLPAVHIAGTKGKGSTSVMAAGILSAAGYRTGLFTSPHVDAFEERIVVDGRQPTRDHFVDLVNRLVGPVERMDAGSAGGGPTYFELATALAWLYFLRSEGRDRRAGGWTGGPFGRDQYLPPDGGRDHKHQSRSHECAWQLAGANRRREGGDRQASEFH